MHFLYCKDEIPFGFARIGYGKNLVNPRKRLPRICQVMDMMISIKQARISVRKDPMRLAQTVIYFSRRQREIGIGAAEVHVRNRF